MFFKRLKCLIFSAILFITLIPIQVLAEETNVGLPPVGDVSVDFVVNGGMNGKIQVDSTDLNFGDSHKYTYPTTLGLDVLFKVIPNPHYHIKEVLINDVPQAPSATNEYSIEHIDEQYTVKVTYEKDKYTVSLVQPTDGGKIVFDNGRKENASFDYESSVAVKFKPNSDYKLDKIFYIEDDGTKHDVDNGPNLNDLPNNVYLWTIENIDRNIEVHAEFSPILKIPFNAITIIAPEDYATEEDKIIFANQPVTIQVNRDKIQNLPEGKDVYIEVKYMDKNITSEGTNSIELTEGGIIKEINLHLKPKESRRIRDKPYNVDIGTQINLVKEGNRPNLNIGDLDSNKAYNKNIQLNAQVNNANNINLSGLKRITYWFDSEEPTGDVNVIFETNATSFTDEEKNSAPNEYPFTIDAAENNGAKKLYVKAEFLSGKSTIISKDIDIDTVAPKVDLVYDNNNAQNGEYFNKERTATLTVTERSDHFDKNTAKNNIVIKQFNGKGEVIDEPQYTIGEWNTTPGDTPDKDKHTIEIKYTGEAVYKIDFE